MGRSPRLVQNTVYLLIFLVGLVAGGIANGGIRWENMSVQAERSTGWGLKADNCLPVEALLPEKADINLVLFLPTPEPEPRQGAKVRRTVELPASPRALSAIEVKQSRENGAAGRSNIGLSREWQPPPRAPDWA